MAPFLLRIIPLFIFFSTIPSSSPQLPDTATFIIRVDSISKPSIFPTHLHWYRYSLISTPSRIIHTYASAFHGFSARLFDSEVAMLRQTRGILAVIPEQVRHIQTTRSPYFLGLETTDRDGLLKESDFGSDLVIAVIDTGIWPERKSFHDRDLSSVPSKWKGSCSSEKGFPCNKKLIGARYFCGGYEAANGKMNESMEMRSPRDSDGHGTHTASIAAGRYVFPASALGNGRGHAAGMAPKARLAVYKACWLSGCFDSDITAAFDAAVADGADIVSLSVGGVIVPYHLDAIATAAFGATDAGIFVSASAGNGGPMPLSVTNVAPWVTTVGAGTIDRDFLVDVKLGNGKILTGSSIYSSSDLFSNDMYPIAYAGGEGSAGYSSSLCLEDSLKTSVVKGKIVLCDRGTNSRTAKGAVVKKAGGVGMILANGDSDGEGLVADCHVLPATAVGAIAGTLIRKYISSASGTKKLPTATLIFKGTKIGIRPAPVVASFSARGPNPETPEILKPDLIAPGLNILGAWPDNVGPSSIISDARRTEFNILSGTSMACPHVSGLAALLKAAHPEWSPAAIRSALMTTAYTSRNNFTMEDESTGNASTIMDHGAGHVNPQKAMNPGLVFDAGARDYVDFLCALNYSKTEIMAVTKMKSWDCNGAKKREGHLGNLNYPSLSAVFRQEKGEKVMKTQFIRTATNVGEGKGVYEVSVKAGRGLKVVVEPERMAFRRGGQKLRFVVRVEAAAAELENGSESVKSGLVVWSDGVHFVRMPLVVTIQQPI